MRNGASFCVGMIGFIMEVRFTEARELIGIECVGNAIKTKRWHGSAIGGRLMISQRIKNFIIGAFVFVTVAWFGWLAGRGIAWFIVGIW